MNCERPSRKTIENIVLIGIFLVLLLIGIPLVTVGDPKEKFNQTVAGPIFIVLAVLYGILAICYVSICNRCRNDQYHEIV